MRVLLVDDHALFRGALRLALEKAFVGAELAESESAEEAIAAMDEAPADLVLIDLDLPGMNGRDLLKVLKRRANPPRCVVVSGADSIEEIRGAVRAGADGYVLKRSSIQVLRHALSMILAGERYVPLPDASLASERGTSGVRPKSRDAQALVSLTARQRDVLLLLADGFSNKRIAQRLGLLEGTVKVHLRDIFRKLHVSNRTQAAMLGAQLAAERRADDVH